MEATILTNEATRYLEAIDFFRSVGLDVKWRSEANEVGVLGVLGVPPEHRCPTCERCAGPLVRINGKHVCLRT